MLQIREIQTASAKKIGWIELSNPKRLNVLTLNMVTSMYEQLKKWRTAPEIAAILLSGAGNKGFCAGGDVVEILELAKSDTSPLATAPYFINEYRVDHLIHRYPKPVIAYGAGIVMGGGIGLFAGASHRIVTRESVFSMPEITIGLFPDVGATWFLNRMPGRCGLFAAMTAARMNAADVSYLGLADYYLPATDIEAITQLLAKCELNGDDSYDRDQLDQLFNSCSDRLPQEDMENRFQKHQGLISSLCDSQDPITINSMLQELNPPDEWMSQCRNQHLNGSPLSASVIAAQLRDGRFMSLEKVFQTELNMAVNMTRLSDFDQGVSALLIHKHNAPQWRWQNTEDVPEDTVSAIFSSPWQLDEHPFAQLNPNPGCGLEIK